jgi:hypothetical protein
MQWIMRQRWFWFLVVIGVLCIPLLADYALANARIDQVRFDYTIDPPEVVADGKSSATITLHVTENGEPRVHDMFQIWFEVGGGLLTPDTAFTDEQGVITITYRPNPASPYTPSDFAQIAVMDASIGRLVEVRRQESIQIPLVEPKS